MAHLIDTGVLLRVFDRNDPHHSAIRATLRRFVRSGERLVTASQNIAEFWNVSSRPTSARGGYGHTPERVQRRVATIEQFCKVLTESEQSYSRWKQLLAEHRITGVSVHDARLVAIMETHGITQLLTLNAADFRRFGQVQAELPA